MFKKGSGIQKKLAEALQDVNWGASSTTMNEIAEASFYEDDFKEIFAAIWKNLDASQKNWRVMFKAISLLEYLLKNGVATCVDETRDQIYYLRNLENFSVMDQGKERGQGVRDKVQVILGMVQDNDAMQLERQKARRLKKKFANTKSVGSAPAPAPAPAATPAKSASATVAQAGNAVKGFFNNLAPKQQQQQFNGPSYRVKGGELADIPVSGQVMKPAATTPSTASVAANKVKTGLATFGQKVSGAVSSAYTSVSTTVQQHTTAAAPAERRPTPLRNFRDLPDDDNEPEPEPEPEPTPAPAPKPAPAKPKVTRATKEAQALFNFGDMPVPAAPAESTPSETFAEPAQPEPAPAAPAAPAADVNDLFGAPTPATTANPSAAALFGAAAQPAAQPVTQSKPADDFDFFNDITIPAQAPAQPAAQPAAAAQTDVFGGLVNFSSSSSYSYGQPQQQAYQQQAYQQQYNQQAYAQQQQAYAQQQAYQQRLYQQQMYQQQMYQQQQQQMGGFNMQGF